MTDPGGEGRGGRDDADERGLAEAEGDLPFPGIWALDHTADVGLGLEAPDLGELLRRAVRGTAWLLHERVPAGPSGERRIGVESAEPSGLLRELLRELLWWHERDGVTAVELGRLRLDEGAGGSLRLRASVGWVRAATPPVREIKGVTLHGLLAEPAGSGWRGRVIFDV